MTIATTDTESPNDTEKLSGENYVTWLVNINRVPKLKNCWEAVGSSPPAVQLILDDKDAPLSRSELKTVLQTFGDYEDVRTSKDTARKELAALDWMPKDDVAPATLQLDEADTHHAPFRARDTAREAWNAINELSRSRNMAWSTDLRRPLATMQKRSNEGMTAYVNRGTILRYEMGQLGQEQTEADLVASLLSGLAATYASTVELLENGEIPSFRSATKRLMAAAVKCLGAADESHEDRWAAFFAVGEHKQEPAMGERQCFHSNRPGHINRFFPRGAEWTPAEVELKWRSLGAPSQPAGTV